MCDFHDFPKCLEAKVISKERNADDSIIHSYEKLIDSTIAVYEAELLNSGPTISIPPVVNKMPCSLDPL